MSVYLYLSNPQTCNDRVVNLSNYVMVRHVQEATWKTDIQGDIYMQDGGQCIGGSVKVTVE